MELAAKFCHAISEVIKSHRVEICTDDVVGALLTVACAHSKSVLGIEKTLIHLTTQMAILTNKDVDVIQAAIDRMKNSVALQQANPKAAIIHGVLKKIGKS